MSARGELALEALVEMRLARLGLDRSTAATYCDCLDHLRAVEGRAFAVADAEIADRERPPPVAGTPAAIRAEIARLEAENAAATQWGAASGARHERISELQVELRRAVRAAAAKDDGA